VENKLIVELVLDEDDARCVRVLFRWLLTKADYTINIDENYCITTHSISEGMLDKLQGAA